MIEFGCAPALQSRYESAFSCQHRQEPRPRREYQRFRDPCPVENLVENASRTLKQGERGKSAKNEGGTQATTVTCSSI